MGVSERVERVGEAPPGGTCGPPRVTERTRPALQSLPAPRSSSGAPARAGASGSPGAASLSGR